MVIGNAVRRDNPEAVEAERRGLPLYSMPQALGHFFLAERRPLVIAGTHGKTTTTSLAAWVYADGGAEPGFLIGGVPKNLGVSFNAGRGERFIVEGDEYNAAYFDRGPKFLHYRPETLVLTSVEHDHADLYPTPESLLDAYGRLVELVPPDGLVIACGDLPDVRRVAEPLPRAAALLRPRRGQRPAPGRRRRGRRGDHRDGAPRAHRQPLRHRRCARAAASRWCCRWPASTTWSTRWRCGRRRGATACRPPAWRARWGVSRAPRGARTSSAPPAASPWSTTSPTIPTAVALTLAGLRRRYAGRRLTALFEPRSLTAGRRFFQQRYADAFAGADRVLLAPVHYAGRWSADELLDVDRLAGELTAAGVEARACGDTDDVLATALGWAETGDVFVTMSSGSFDGLPHRLHRELEARAAGG